MAFNITVNSQFKPFSYQELLAPVLMATQAHQALEEEYDTLMFKADIIKQRAEAEPDAKWAKRYKEYANRLQQSADILASRGLDPMVRRQLSQARKDYSSAIDPAIKAIEQQQKLSNAQYSQNPSLRMVYGNMPTIDQLIGDMTLTPTSYSGADVEKSAMLSAGAASARRAISQFARDPRNVGYMKYLKQTGYNSQAFENLLNEARNSNDPNVNILAQITDQVKQQFNNFEGIDNAGKRRLEGEILSGLFKGITYKDDTTYQQDAVYMAELQAELKRREQEGIQAAKKLQAAKAAINPKNIYSQNEIKNSKTMIDLTKSYFDRDDKGNYTLNSFGKSVYRSGRGPLKDYLNEITGNKNLNEEQIFKLAGKAYAQQIKDLGNIDEGKYDATKLTEYEYAIDSSDAENWKNIIAGQASGKLYPTDWDNKTLMWSDEDSVDISDAYKNEAKPISIQYSRYGFTLKLKDKEGNVVRYKLPKGINPRTEANIETQLAGLDAVQELYKSMGSNDSMPTPKEVRDALQSIGQVAPPVITKNDLQELHSRLENNAMMYISQLGNTNTNKPQEWRTFGY